MLEKPTRKKIVCVYLFQPFSTDENFYSKFSNVYSVPNWGWNVHQGRTHRSASRWCSRRKISSSWWVRVRSNSISNRWRLRSLTRLVLIRNVHHVSILISISSFLSFCHSLKWFNSSKKDEKKREQEKMMEEASEPFFLFCFAAAVCLPSSSSSLDIVSFVKISNRARKGGGNSGKKGRKIFA